MAPIGKWHSAKDEIPVDLPTWVVEPVPLELDRAVTLIATVSASPPIGDTTEAHGYSRHHEHAFYWRLRDSLDGEAWFTLANGALTPRQTQQVTRWSAPLGTMLAFEWWLRPMTVRTFLQTGAIQSSEYCSAGCASHDEIVTRDASFDIAVRLI